MKIVFCLCVGLVWSSSPISNHFREQFRTLGAQLDVTLLQSAECMTALVAVGDAFNTCAGPVMSSATSAAMNTEITTFCADAECYALTTPLADAKTACSAMSTAEFDCMTSVYLAYGSLFCLKESNEFCLPDLILMGETGSAADAATHKSFCDSPCAGSLHAEASTQHHHLHSCLITGEDSQDTLWDLVNFCLGFDEETELCKPKSDAVAAVDSATLGPKNDEYVLCIEETTCSAACQTNIDWFEDQLGCCMESYMHEAGLGFETIAKAKTWMADVCTSDEVCTAHPPPSPSSGMGKSVGMLFAMVMVTFVIV